MKRKSWSVLALCWSLMLMLLLAGCKDKQGNEPAETSQSNNPPVSAGTLADGGDKPQLGVSEDQLSFGLTKPETPTFQEGLTDGDTAPLPQGESEMYTEIDGYAYRLDPATMEPVGGPLDRITHEPVVISDTVAMPEETTQSPSQEVPTEDTKYPNTGIFLEDD